MLLSWGYRPAANYQCCVIPSFIKSKKIRLDLLFIDLLHLMAQQGITPIANQTAAQLVQLCPATHDGLLFDPQDDDEGVTTLTFINRMIGDINHYGQFRTPQEELSQCWHEDMLWWGPTGIGATYTIDRYISSINARSEPKMKAAGSTVISAAWLKASMAVFLAGPISA